MSALHKKVKIGCRACARTKSSRSHHIIALATADFHYFQDTPMSCEPTLLPEPNHVMLNHLYALSIKDGVMVLSTTQRFKKKYVTTLLYKPMGTRIPEES